MRFKGRRLACALAFLLMSTPGAVAFAQDGHWVEVTGGPTTPGPRREFGAIYDPGHQRHVIFCGFDDATGYQLFNDVWVLSLEDDPQWSRLVIPGDTPGPRHSPQWGYDAARNRVLVFGGYGRHYPDSPSYEYLNDVWQLSLDGTPHWTELHPSGQAPTGRLAGAAVFDPMRQRFVGFGGTIGAPVDTWVLDLRGQPSWQPLTTEAGVSPNGGWGMSSVFDARRDRMLIFGGSTGDGYYGASNQVWELSLRDRPKWRPITATDTPPSPRRSTAAVFDPLRDRMVVYGGFDAVPASDQFLGDAWALGLGDAPAWTRLWPSGNLPAGRDALAAAFDPIRGRMVIHGGWSGSVMLGDTWFLEWGGESDDAELVPNSSATPLAAHLCWDVSGATGNLAAIYRREAGGEWTSMAEAEVSVDGRILFDDASVTPGRTYGYMAVVASERGETFGGVADVPVPTNAVGVGPDRAFDFVLASIAPNPVVRNMTVSYSLASSEPARLELLDVTGRRWLSRELSSGAGRHQVQLSTGGQVPDGLYFLRLSQGARTSSARVAITEGH